MKRITPHSEAVEAALTRNWQTAVQVAGACLNVAPRTANRHLKKLVEIGKAELKPSFPAYLYRGVKK